MEWFRLCLGVPAAPPITVLIPAFNRERFIGPCIESILRQTYPNVEILVYDDGSTDGTAQAAAGYKSVRVVRDLCNRGVGYARNRLLEACTTETAAWQDSDDISNIHRLAAQIAAAGQSRSGKSLVYANWKPFQARLPERWTEMAIENAHDDSRCIGGALFTVAPARSIGFCEQITLGGEDIVWRRAMEACCEVHLLQRTLYYYRQHPERITARKRLRANAAEKRKSDLAYRRALDLLDAPG